MIKRHLKKIETPGQPCRAFLSRRSSFGVPKRLYVRLTNRWSATSSSWQPFSWEPSWLPFSPASLQPSSSQPFSWPPHVLLMRTGRLPCRPQAGAEERPAHRHRNKTTNFIDILSAMLRASKQAIVRFLHRFKILFRFEKLQLHWASQRATLHDVIYFQNYFKYNFCISAKNFSEFIAESPRRHSCKTQTLHLSQQFFHYCPQQYRRDFSSCTAIAVVRFQQDVFQTSLSFSDYISGAHLQPPMLPD